MAFSLTGTVGSTSINLSNKSPYSLVSARGFSGAEVRRVTSRGPAQDGDTDKGYRLAPRMMEIVIGIQGASNSALDGHRDTLTSFFKPLPSTPIKLRYTRDDAELRQIDCYTVGDIKIDLIPDHRVGHYHEATIRLRAADPSWYDPTPGTVTVTGTAGLSATWYLAGGIIGTAQVLMSGSVPTPGQAWSYAGTLGTATSRTLVFRTGKVATANQLAFYADGGTASPYNNALATDTGNFYVNDLSVGREMTAGTLNYFLDYLSGNSYFRESGVSDAQLSGVLTVSQPGLAMIGSAGGAKWRTNTALGTGWAEPIHLYALYSPSLSLSQMNALSGYMMGAQGGSVSQLLVIPYEGDLPSYPSISIRGPITGARIVNSITGYELDFGTVVIGAGTTYVINTDPAQRTVLQGATNKRGELTSDSDLGAWSLLPAPQAAGGTNIITVNGSNTGTATQVSIVYSNRYVGY